jgi:hypothetical protein
MSRLSPRPVGVCLFVFALALLGACGSSDNKSDAPVDAGSNTAAAGENSSENSTDATNAKNENSGSSSLPDACELLADSDVEAVLGSAPEGKAADRSGSGGGGPQVRGCMWGELSDESGLLAVQIATPDPETKIDYLKSVVNASGGGGTPVDIGENGQLLDRAYIPYGGGVGKSVMFENDGNTVVVGATKATEEQIKAAAETVLGNL